MSVVQGQDVTKLIVTTLYQICSDEMLDLFLEHCMLVCVCVCVRVGVTVIVINCNRLLDIL